MVIFKGHLPSLIICFGTERIFKLFEKCNCGVASLRRFPGADSSVPSIRSKIASLMNGQAEVK
jgi:hypothetical protein